MILEVQQHLSKTSGLDNICSWMPLLLYCIMHVIVRLVSYAFITACCLLYGALVLILRFSSNFVNDQNGGREKDFAVNIPIK